MALSMLKPNEAATNTGLAAVPHHFRNGGVKDPSDVASSAERSPKASHPMETDDATYRNLSSLNLFPTSVLARQMLGGLSLHATLTTSPSVYAPNWFPNPTSPPPTPVNASKRNNNNHVTSSTSAKKNKKRIKTSPVEPALTNSVESIPDSPLSPPTSGSSPQSNGSGQDINCKNGEKDKLFTCRACNRSFGYKHVLQNHERTHTGEKPFECRECHKRFTRDHHLKTHMRLHTGEKPYHCTHCDRQFVQVANLRRHLRVHTGERPYACDLCSSKFSDSNQLKAHTLIHKGEKPFHCTLCNGKFRRRHHLMHHKCPSKASDAYHSPDTENMDEEEDDDMSRDTALEIDEDVESSKYSPSNDFEQEFPSRKSPADYTPARSPDSYLISINNNRKLRERKSRDIRRVIRVADVQGPILNLATIPPLLPEQTEPEDLSMPKAKMRNQNNNHEETNGMQNYRGKLENLSPRRISRSPSVDNDSLLTSLYHHPKLRRHVGVSKNTV